MKVYELIKELKHLDPNVEVMILDGFNGGGTPRKINLGPVEYKITTGDVKLCADCEEVGEETKVIIMGYGCY